MDRKRGSIAVIGIAVVFLAITSITASLWTSNTPLYTIRMEQASSRMNFLPTAMNGFAYTTEKGYELNYNVAEYCNDVRLFDTGVWTCLYSTCSGLPDDTCVLTCPESCYGTCNDPTCPNTCGNTCNPTCNSFTCYETCKLGTCWETICDCPP